MDVWSILIESTESFYKVEGLMLVPTYLITMASAVQWKRVGESNVEVSSEGQVRKDGMPWTPYIGHNGYEQVTVAGSKREVHRLVALAFIPNPDNKPFVDHINGKPLDNRVSNLRWATYLENRHNARTGPRKVDLPRGVYPVKGGFIGRIRHMGEDITSSDSMDVFETADEASNWYETVRLCLSGDFYREPGSESDSDSESDCD